MKTISIKIFLTICISVSTMMVAHAQFGTQQQLWQTQMMRMGETFIRVAEPGQIVDTVSVWGDITTPGNYIVPKGTTASQLLSYARGPARTITQETVLDWSKLRIEVNITQFDSKQGHDNASAYTFRYNEALPKGLRNTELGNKDIVLVEVKRKPAFVDWVRVIAPVISALATTIGIINLLTR